MSREHIEALRAKIDQIEARKPLNRAEALFVSAAKGVRTRRLVRLPEEVSP